VLCDSSFLETHTSNSTWMGALFVTHIVLAMVVFLGIHQGVGFLPFSKVVVLCLILMSSFKLYLMVSRSNLDSWLYKDIICEFDSISVIKIIKEGVSHTHLSVAIVDHIISYW